MISVGTSGYSYDDWKGPFYPPALRARDYLAHYSGQFDACEINFSYYRMPEARTLAGMLERSGGRVTFTIKLTRTITHEPTDDVDAELARFRAALVPWQEAGVLGAVLAQFPHGFRPRPEGRERLCRILDGLKDVPRVVEFRNRAWIGQDTFAQLRDQGAALCCVDEPDLPGLLPRLGVVTAAPGYVRFHGRNQKTWYEHDQAWQRYDYAYSDDELQSWVPRIQRMAELADPVFVFFNNHFQAKAVTAARRLRELLGL